jgi:hypothetical protein
VSYLHADSNPFEFAVVAGLRAKQLMAGCVPRVAPAHTCARTASLEVREGKVARVPTGMTTAAATAQQPPACPHCGRPTAEPATTATPGPVGFGHRCGHCGHTFTVRVEPLARAERRPAAAD